MYMYMRASHSGTLVPCAMSRGWQVQTLVAGAGAGVGVGAGVGAWLQLLLRGEAAVAASCVVGRCVAGGQAAPSSSSSAAPHRPVHVHCS
jgi:hypothetical protein